MADIHINDVFLFLDQLNLRWKIEEKPMFAAVDEIAGQFSIRKSEAIFVLAKWMHANGYVEK